MKPLTFLSLTALALVLGGACREPTESSQPTDEVTMVPWDPSPPTTAPGVLPAFSAAASIIDCTNTPGAGGIARIISDPPRDSATYNKDTIPLVATVIRDDPRTAGIQSYCQDRAQKVKWFTPMSGCFSMFGETKQGIKLKATSQNCIWEYPYAFIAGAWSGTAYISPGIRDTSYVLPFVNWKPVS